MDATATAPAAVPTAASESAGPSALFASWTIRCRGCGHIRPWLDRAQGHDCPNRATLGTALPMFLDTTGDTA